MSHYNVKPIRLDFKPSPLLIGILAGAAVGACTILICMPIGVLFKIGLCLMVLLASGYHVLDKGLRRFPWSCTGLALDAKGGFTASTRADAVQNITILPSSFVASYLTILNYRVEGKRWQRSVLLLPDNVEQDAFRRLRVWLRWARQTSLATET